MRATKIKRDVKSEPQTSRSELLEPDKPAVSGPQARLRMEQARKTDLSGAQIERMILDVAARELRSLDFARRRRELRKRVSSDLSHHLFVDVLAYREVIVVPAAAVRSEQVETTYHRVSGVAQELQEHTRTISFPASAYLGDLELTRIRIGSLDDCSKAAMTVCECFLKLVPILETFSNLNSIETALNEHPQVMTPLHPVLYSRAARGVILANVVNPERFEFLVDAYAGELKKVERGYFVPLIERLANLLRDAHADARN